MRDESYKNAADVFIKMAHAENKSKVDFINNCDIKEMGIYKREVTE